MTSPVGLHRVAGAGRACCRRPPWRLDAGREIGADEVRIAVERLNLDAASFRQLPTKHGGDGAAVRAEVLEIIAYPRQDAEPGHRLRRHAHRHGRRGRPATRRCGLQAGDRVATLVSLTLTPLAITDGLARWDGRSEQVPGAGHAILFARSIAAVLPDDLDPELALAVLDVCGAPALTARVVRRHATRGTAPTVAVIGGAGKAARCRWPRRGGPVRRTVGVVPVAAERDRAARRPAWPTRSRWPTPATRSRWPPR